jgi:hypothetical protein
MSVVLNVQYNQALRYVVFNNKNAYCQRIGEGGVLMKL